MSTDPRRRLGALGERLAAEHLAGAGYRIVARNYRTRYGELDLVAADARCIVFCEVKTRVEGTGGPPGALDAVGPAKRKRLRLMARQWLQDDEPRPRRPGLRFDAVGVTVSPAGALVTLDHVENAF